MLGWWMRRRMSTSESRLSRSLLLSRSMEISFTATSVSPTTCRPKNTCEYAPDPIGRSSSYSPTTRLRPPRPALEPSPIAPPPSWSPTSSPRLLRDLCAAVLARDAAAGRSNRVGVVAAQNRKEEARRDRRKPNQSSSPPRRRGRPSGYPYPRFL
jgi:hypothetical protein